jgi:soluble lytic murein transglycosylase-like protein
MRLPMPKQARRRHRPNKRENAHSSTAPPTADDVCRALEQSAAENALPVEFFARVIWQESRFNAMAVSTKGAAGIAQFMPQTASWHGLSDPFDPIEALRHSAAYLRELLDRFGNLGLLRPRTTPVQDESTPG